MRSGFETCEPKRLASLLTDSDVSPASPLSEEAGTTIGRYKLLQLIGEGGFGSVFMAEQQTPVVRKVALKIIKLGMDTKLVIARFEAERQALALMDHPNIAKVFDAGATDTGRPYFVMELVKGIPITDYCDQQKLNLRQRLELFIPVCKAVQHAHQKGIIHRDLKPSNVLVTLHDGTPVPKVIDFGIAKATNARLTEHTLFTEYRQFIGTPEYISPEQADISALDVDTRSDVYSLGVLLYQLLTGTTPFESKQLRNVAYAEIQRIIREVDPPKPSTRLTTIATMRDAHATPVNGEPKRLSRLVAGELDWIVMKCLEKDRARRYDTASALADDISRHLTGDPVDASPPSKLYRLRKFSRKHRIPMTVAVLLTLATLISTWQAVSATRARSAVLAAKQRTDLQSTMTEAVNNFLNEDILRQASTQDQMTPEPNRDLKVRDALDHAAERVGEKFKDQPLIKARILQTIGEAYTSIGENPKALRYLREALDVSREFAGEDDPMTLKIYVDLARTFQIMKVYSTAEPLYLAALAGQRRTAGERNIDTLRTKLHLGYMYCSSGEYDKSEPLLEEAFAGCRESLGQQHRLTVQSMVFLGELDRLTGKLDRAEQLLQQAVDTSRTTLSQQSSLSLLAVHYLARVYMSRGQHARAEPMLMSVIEGRRKVLGEASHDTLIAMADLVETYKRLGQDQKAEALLLQERELALRDKADIRAVPSTPGTVDHFALSPGELSVCKAIASDSLGNVFVSGESSDSHGKKHGIVRERLSGGSTWATVCDFSSYAFADFYGLATDQIGNLFVTGDGASDLDHFHWVVLQRPPGGRFSEIDTFPALGTGWAAGATVDKDGDLFVAGVERVPEGGLAGLQPSFLPNRGNLRLSSSDGESIWIVRKRAKGESAFRTVDTFSGSHHSADPQGAISITRGPAAGVYVFGYEGNLPPEGLCAWIVRKTTDGGATWTTVDRFQSEPQSVNMAFSAAADLRGSLFVVGSVTKRFARDPKSDPEFQSWWIVRKSIDGGETWQTVDEFRLSPGTMRMQNTANAVFTDGKGNVFVIGTSVDEKGTYHSIVRGTSGGPWVTLEDYVPGTGLNASGRACALDANGSLYFTVTANWDQSMNRDWLVRSLPRSTWSNLIARHAGGVEATENALRP